jgi:hypothetical protein
MLLNICSLYYQNYISFYQHSITGVWHNVSIQSAGIIPKKCLYDVRNKNKLQHIQFINTNELFTPFHAAINLENNATSHFRISTISYNICSWKERNC